MKTIIFPLLLLASFGAKADVYTDCGLKAGTYKLSAQLRDQGDSPQQALNVMLGNEKNPDPKALATVKKIINQVYFDTSFAYAGGQALYDQMYDLCINGPKNYKPLK